MITTPRAQAAPRIASVLRSRTGELALAVVIALIGAVVTWFRVPGSHRDRVWAEDSNIFLMQGLDQGPWAVLFQGYAGYQHFVPRLVIALLFPFLDLARYPVVVFAICAILTGLVAAAVFWLSRDLVPWVPARILLGLITVLLPLATQETIGNLADIHTYAMWLAPWLLLYRPRRWGSSAAWAVVAFLVVMTEIQAVFFVFLVFFRLGRSERHARPVFAAFAVGAVIQLVTAVSGDRNTSNGPLSIPSTVIGWLINTVFPLATADPGLIRAWVLQSGLLVAFLILIPIVLAVVLAVRWGDARQRLLTVALLLGSAAIYTGSAWANSDVWFMYAEEGLDQIGRLVVNIRYGVASGMMLVATIPIAAAVMVRRWPERRWLKVVGLVGFAIILAVFIHGCLTAFSLRDFVGQWRPAVEQAVVACSQPDPPAGFVLPVAPDRSVELSCDDILQYTGSAAR